MPRLNFLSLLGIFVFVDLMLAITRYLIWGGTWSSIILWLIVGLVVSVPLADQSFISSPTISGGAIYLRSETTLFRINSATVPTPPAPTVRPRT